MGLSSITLKEGASGFSLVKEGIASEEKNISESASSLSVKSFC